MSNIVGSVTYLAECKPFLPIETSSQPLFGGQLFSVGSDYGMHAPELVRLAVSASQNLGQAPQTLLTKHQASCQRQPILSLRWKVTFKKKLAISTCLCRTPRISVFRYIRLSLYYCCIIVILCYNVVFLFVDVGMQRGISICQGTTWNKSLWPYTSEVQELEVMCPTGRSGINAHLPTCRLSHVSLERFRCREFLVLGTR